MRARSIKPGICDNEVLGTADPFYTLLFERLWMIADREGRLEDRPLRIKAQAFPYRDGLDVEPMLQWLSDHDFIARYEAGGARYIQVLKFSDHQRPHKNEQPSVIPPINGESTAKAVPKHNQGSAMDALTPSSLTPSSLTPDCLTVTSAAPPVRADVDLVFDHWRQEWGHPNAKLDPKRRKRIRTRLADFSVDQLCQAISGFKHSPWHTGTDPKGQGVVYDGIETLLRDTAQVETGIRLYAHPPQAPPQVEQLSPVERVLRANGVNRDGRVVAEQFGSSSADMGNAGGDVRQSPHSGFRRLGS